VRGPEHPETVEALNNLELLFQKIGDYAKAEPLYQAAELTIISKIFSFTSEQQRL
jgi:hypothetical protein